jgi:hypothetical protein
MLTLRIGLLSLVAFSIAPAQDALRITTTTPLVSGFAGGTYLQTLTAAGGSPPYTWVLLSGTLPIGINLTPSGTLTGLPTVVATSNVTIQVADSAGSRATQAFSLDIIPPGTLARAGVLAHIATGGSWTTTITLVNSSTLPVPVRVNFRGDDGSALSLPLQVVQRGAVQAVTTATFDGVLDPNTTLLVNTSGLQSTVVGWGEVLSPGPIGGFAIFRTTLSSGASSEGTSPLQTQLPSTIVLPYDNTSGFVMGFAFVNVSMVTANITATIWDDNGTQLGSQPIALTGNGHSSFVVPTLLPLTAGKRGIVKFQSTGSGGIVGLGLRFSSFGTFTSVPVL